MYESPFYHKALKHGHKAPKCGKVDDTTMILAEVMAIESKYQIIFWYLLIIFKQRYYLMTTFATKMALFTLVTRFTNCCRIASPPYRCLCSSWVYRHWINNRRVLFRPSCSCTWVLAKDWQACSFWDKIYLTFLNPYDSTFWCWFRRTCDSWLLLMGGQADF
jgi:hypothetical protein